MEIIFGVLCNNCILQYINLAKFKVLLYNLKCGLWDGSILIFGAITKNHQILITAKISTHMVRIYTVYVVIFEGCKICSFCCQACNRELLVLKKFYKKAIIRTFLED